MKTVLITAYASNPRNVSEDAMGWNYILQAARYQRVIAVTRKNNRKDIEHHFATHPEHAEQASRIQYLYYDWPKWMLFWKKGPRLSLIYFLCWQLGVVLFLKRKKLDFDLTHNLNFHNDWTPSFLWMLGKPFVWGPVGHHPAIPSSFAISIGKRALIKDRILWGVKKYFWNVDPFLAICKRKARLIWCMHKQAAEKLRLTHDYMIVPSIAADPVTDIGGEKNGFVVLSVGRFVPLKGFDVTIQAFTRFYRTLSEVEQAQAKLVIVGKGPLKKKLQALITELEMDGAIEIVQWMPQEQLHALYRQSSVYLFPSHEGAGLVVAEAMRYGLPVVCWDGYGPGTITHIDSEVKVKYSKYEASYALFAYHLQRLFRDKDFYAKERELALERFHYALRWDVRGEQLKRFYDAALQPRYVAPKFSLKRKPALLKEAAVL